MNSLNTIEPYQFEPEAHPIPSSVDTNIEEDPDPDHEDRQHHTRWCLCDRCSVMPSPLECRCCQEIDRIKRKCEELDIKCITQHEGFDANFLNRHVLEVALHEYIYYEGPLDMNEPINETYRYIAYRRFTRWIWHRLRKYQRKVLPACVVSAIRNAFPSEEYTGFKYARPY